jgi:hypothetical protein
LDAAVRGRAHSEHAAPELPWGRYELCGLATTAPGAGRAFGELGPTAPFGRNRDALDALLVAARRLPWLEAAPDAIAARIRGRG